MSVCQKCWADSALLSMDGQDRLQFPVYADLVRKRDVAGKRCTPEEQAGHYAQQCKSCWRMTIHEQTGEAMCGCE